MDRDTLGRLLDGWLAPQNFTDVAVNGLQVQGKQQVSRVACGVSANAAFIDAAIAAQADALVVHHGIVWGGIQRIDGWLHARVRKLLLADVNLFAYHLPLDAQPRFGNNAGLAAALSLTELRPFGKYKGQLIGVAGSCTPVDVAGFCQRVAAQVGPVKACYGPATKQIATVGVCTGGAPDLFHDAIGQRLDAYITGEDTEWVKAVAEESGCVFVAAGHHATERFGPRGLAQALIEQGVDAIFVDVDNPA
jgi:dinuclear metal center YbgI/SA1388 family protein